MAASFSKVSRWDDRPAKEQQQGGGERVGLRRSKRLAEGGQSVGLNRHTLENGLTSSLVARNARLCVLVVCPDGVYVDARRPESRRADPG